MIKINKNIMNVKIKKYVKIQIKIKNNLFKEKKVVLCMM